MSPFGSPAGAAARPLWRGVGLSGQGATAAALAVCASTPQHSQQALELARHLQLPLLPAETAAIDCTSFNALMVVTDQGPLLQQTGRNAPGPVQIDFGSKVMRHRRRGGHNELLGKAVGVGRKPDLRVIDATAGLGRDAFVLADLGCQVELCEREPVLVAMLQSALERAASSADTWLCEVTARMRLHPGDVLQQPLASLHGADIVYLDPMFPRRDKAAAVKKEMALFQRILPATCELIDGAALFDWAASLQPARIVVKRPRKATTLIDRPPSHSLSGKAVRYDVYVLKAIA